MPTVSSIPENESTAFICFEVNLVKKGFETRCVAQECNSSITLAIARSIECMRSFQRSWSGEHDMSTSQRAYEEVTNSSKPSKSTVANRASGNRRGGRLALCRIAGVYAL